MPAIRRSLAAIHRRLYRRFGPQHWWPGETPFEVAVGAILTQNTAWLNASRAVQALKRRGLLDPRALERLPRRRLAAIIRSSGYFNQKAARLKGFVRHLLKRHAGSMRRMARGPWPALREELLGLKGIGPETADSILLYALNKPVFVVDAYTRRVLARHGLISWDASYAGIQSLFMGGRASVPVFNEAHALFVHVGKTLCRPNPRCGECPLRTIGRIRLEPGATRAA